MDESAESSHDHPTDGSEVTDSTAVTAVLAATRAFYAAFESADLDAMSEAWEHSDRVSCVHPGWTVLRGWASVASSWAAMFNGPQRLQFILTNESVVVHGDTAWVTIDENILDADSSATVTAINVFTLVEATWKMVAHHGSPVMTG